MLSLIKDLLVGASTLYLNVIVPLATPADVALNVGFERFELKTDVWAPGFRRTDWTLQLFELVWFSCSTLLLKLINIGERQVPLARLIVEVELLSAIAFKLKTVPR